MTTVLERRGSGAGAGAPGTAGTRSPPPRRSRPSAGRSTGSSVRAYFPALDGIRALAVLGVMAYHGGIPWMSGGFLGVDVFFVLSGFLITTLLLEEWLDRGTIRLRAFWARRARRLLPALFAVVLVVAAYAALSPKGSYPGLRRDAVATLLYAANWHFIAAGSNYFAQTGTVSPLTHTWSLSIEEQFYVVWPLVVFGVLRAFKRLGVLLGVCIAGTVASALEMAVLYLRGASATRLDFGTDTHAQSLLAGTALAVVLAMVVRRRQAGPALMADGPAPTAGGPAPARPSQVPSTSGRGASRVLAVLGVIGLVGEGVLWGCLDHAPGVLFEGGFFLVALGAAGVVASVVLVPAAAVGRLLAVRPLRYLGRISYGLYLWHFPLFLWVDGERTGLDGYGLFAVRVALTVAVATLSYYVLERPIRSGNALRATRPLLAAVGAWAAVTAVLLAAVAPAVVPAQAAPSPPVKGAVRVLTIGDSTALTLGMALSSDEAAYGVSERVEAVLGCGVVGGTEVRTAGVVERVARPCDTDPAPEGTPLLESAKTPFGTPVVVPDAERWTAWYRHWITTFDPNVVVVLAGRWEVMTRLYRGRWTNILSPAYASYVLRQLESLVRLAGARGARVVLMTAPCYDAAEQPDGEPPPSDSPGRLAAYNRVVRAAADELRAKVFDLDALVCPGGAFHESVDGVPVRSPDGVHFTPTAGGFLGPRIWPFVLQVAGRRYGRQVVAGAEGG